MRRMGSNRLTREPAPVAEAAGPTTKKIVLLPLSFFDSLILSSLNQDLFQGDFLISLIWFVSSSFLKMYVCVGDVCVLCTL